MVWRTSCRNAHGFGRLLGAVGLGGFGCGMKQRSSGPEQRPENQGRPTKVVGFCPPGLEQDGRQTPSRGPFKRCSFQCFAHNSDCGPRRPESFKLAPTMLELKFPFAVPVFRCHYLTYSVNPYRLTSQITAAMQAHSRLERKSGLSHAPWADPPELVRTISCGWPSHLKKASRYKLEERIQFFSCALVRIAVRARLRLRFWLWVRFWGRYVWATSRRGRQGLLLTLWRGRGRRRKRRWRGRIVGRLGVVAGLRVGRFFPCTSTNEQIEN